jgi:hypothetical protein
MKQEQVVYRHVALPVSAFDHLKQYHASATAKRRGGGGRP